MREDSVIFKWFSPISNVCVFLVVIYYLHQLIVVQKEYINSSLKQIDNVVRQANESIKATNRGLETLQTVMESIDSNTRLERRLKR